MRCGKKILSVFCAVMLLAGYSAAFSAWAQETDTGGLSESFEPAEGLQMEGYNGWFCANVYSAAGGDDNEFTIERESADSVNLVASLRKTNGNANVTDKSRKWIAKEINVPQDATKLTVEFKVRYMTDNAGNLDIGFRSADGKTWESNGHVRLSLGTENVGLIKSDGRTYDYYQKLTAAKEAWNTVKIVLDRANDSMAVYVNGKASGSIKPSTAPILKDGTPTAIGFGWMRAAAGVSAQLDGIAVYSNGAAGSQSSFETAETGSYLNTCDGWSNVNAYTDGGLNNIYTIKTDRNDSGNKVAGFVKGPLSGNSRLWAARAVSLPTGTEQLTVEFKIRSVSGGGLFDIGFGNGGAYGSNGHVRLDFGSSQIIWRAGLSGAWTSAAGLDLTGGWNVVKLTVNPLADQNGAVRGQITAEINGASRGSDWMNSLGNSQVFLPDSVAFGWMRSQAVGAEVEIDDVKIAGVGAENIENGFEETFQPLTSGTPFAGYNGWSVVNEYTYPKLDDNVYSIVRESADSTNFIASFQKTDETKTDKNRKWVGKTMSLPAEMRRISASLRIRRMNEKIGRFDIGFLNGSGSWGDGNGFIGISLGESEKQIRLPDNTYQTAAALHTAVGEWVDVAIILDYDAGSFTILAGGERACTKRLSMTGSHIADGLPTGIGFGFARGAQGTEVQLDDIVVGAAPDVYPTKITDITVTDHQLKSFTITNTASLSNAAAFAAVYTEADGGALTLSDIVCTGLSGENAEKGENRVIVPPRALSVPEGAVVKVFVWNQNTLCPYAAARVRQRADAINFDKLALPPDGDMSKNFTIHVIGDSTSAAYDQTNYPMTGWAQVLGNYFTDNVTINDDAVSGESSRSFYNIPAHWQSTLSEIKAGDYVLIQFGHNDEKQTGTSLVDTSQQLYTAADGSYKEYLKKYIDETKDKGATPILVTSINRRIFGADGNVDTSGSNLMSYVSAMKELAAAENVAVMDLNAKTRLLYEYYGAEGSKALFMNFSAGEYDNFPDGRADNTHLREAGANEVAKLFAIALAESGHELSAYIKR